MLVEGEQLLTPIAQDPRLAAPDALQRFFAAFARYKAGRKPLILPILRAWYADDNAIVREKMRVALADRLRPLVASIIRRGCDEGVFAVSYPDGAARVVLGLTQDLGDDLARLTIAEQGKSDAHKPIEDLVAATTEAVERVLCSHAGSIRLAEVAALDTWFEQTKGATT
jgi:Tetracyclin repressor-like, C-terminal domain